MGYKFQQKILKYLNSNEFNKPLENLRQNFLSPYKNDSLNLAVTDLTNILIHLSKICFKINSITNKKKRKKHEYFDSDCYSKGNYQVTQKVLLFDQAQNEQQRRNFPKFK